jgi:type I restriction enzyme S subunit
MNVVPEQRGVERAMDDLSRRPPQYKRTKLGVIPEDWRVATIGEVAMTSSGTTPSRELADRYYRDGSIAWIKTLDLNNSEIYTTEERVTELALNETALTRYPVGTVVVAMYGGFNQIGRTGLLRIPATVNQALTAITPNAFRLLSEYLLHVLNYRLDYWKSVASSSRKDPNITGRDVREFPIAIPSTEEQRAIADALGDMDGLLGTLDTLIAKKRAIKQGAMQQLLTGKMRLPGFSGDWQEVPLFDVADKQIPFSFAGGPFGSNLKASEYTLHGVRIIQLQNIGDGCFNDDYAIYTSEKKANELRSSNIFPDEIIISKMGDPVARACLVPKHLGRCLMASDGIRLAVDRHRFCTRFIHDYINSPIFRSKALDASTGSTRTRIGLSTLRGLQIRAPRLTEQEAIATVLFEMDAEIAMLERRRDKTRAIKHGMMQWLLTGRVRLVKPSRGETRA